MRKIQFLGISVGAFIAATAAQAQAANDAPPDPAPSNGPTKTISQDQDIVVTAHSLRTNMAGGGMIAVQSEPVVRTTIGQGFIAKQVPVQNSLSSVRMAPGANVGQDNPFGISERGDLSVRGIDQTQMGFVLNGMPLGDPNQYLPNANEWIDNENAKSVTLTQGTSDLSSPVLSASGGLIQIDMRDPSHEMGGSVSGSVGRYNAKRGFARLESGDIGSTGLRAFISYSRVGADNFRGPSHSTRDHADAEVLKDWGDGVSKSALIVQYNNLRNFRSLIPTLAQFNQFGKDLDYVGTYSFNNLNYAKFYPFIRKVWTAQLQNKIVISDHLKLDITPYFRYMQPNTVGASTLPLTGIYYGNVQRNETIPNVYSGNGTQFVGEVLGLLHEYEAGVNASLTWKTGHHEIQAGIWYDHFNQWSQARIAAVDQNGQIPTLDGSVYLRFANGDPVTGTNFREARESVAVYGQDKISLLDDHLKVIFGVKELIVTTTGTNFLPGSTSPIAVHQSKPTPRFGATYSFGDYSQVFFDLITNARPPSPGPTYMDVFNVTTGKKSTVGDPTTPMEYSFAQEIGYRYQGFINFSVAAFHNKLTNHQVNTIVSQNGVLTQGSISAGGETIYGANAELGLRPWHNFSPYISGQYLHSRTDDDLPVGADFLPTKGKASVRTPKMMGSVGLTYDDGHLFSVATFRHVSSQWSTFMNDQKMPAFNTGDLGVGYRLEKVGFLKSPTIQVNLINLFHDAYLGSIGSPTANALPTVGRKGTLIAASQPGYYENSPFTWVFTLKTDF